MDKDEDIWHFPRNSLAEKYLDLLKIGITNRITLFAPRRMGKTVFLVYDLAPLARKRKYLPIYISMWEEANEPHKVIISNLEAAITELKSRQSTLRRLLTSTVQKLKIEGNLGLGKLTTEVELPDNPKAPSSKDIAYINQLFRDLVELSNNRRPLLLLDEIQHLGTNKKFEALTYALRSALDIHSRHIDVVFTGSSRVGLRKLFADTKAPFYEFSDRIEFPRLEKDFIEFLSGVYRKLINQKLDVPKAWKIFKQIDYNPAYMRSVIKIMILENNNNIIEVYRRVLAAIAEEYDYPKQWKALRPIDREIYIALSNGNAIYSERVMKDISKRAGTRVTKPMVQNSIRKLVRLQLITSDGHGTYLIETPGFAQWCTERMNTIG